MSINYKRLYIFNIIFNFIICIAVINIYVLSWDIWNKDDFAKMNTFLFNFIICITIINIHVLSWNIQNKDVVAKMNTFLFNSYYLYCYY